MMNDISDIRVANLAREQNTWMNRVLAGNLNPDDVVKAVYKMIAFTNSPFDSVANFVPGPWLKIHPKFISAIVAEVGITCMGSFSDLEYLTKVPHICDSQNLKLLSPCEAPENLIHLPHLYRLMKLQRKEKKGKLSKDGSANIFYIKAGKWLFAFTVRWSAEIESWHIDRLFVFQSWMICSGWSEITEDDERVDKENNKKTEE